MLDKNDLQQIKNIMDTSLEEFAVIMNGCFNEQNKYIDEKLAPIRQDIIEIKQDIDYIKQKLILIEKRMDFLEEKIDKLAKTQSEDLSAVSGDVGKIKNRFNGFEIKIKQHIPAWN